METGSSYDDNKKNNAHKKQNWLIAYKVIKELFDAKLHALQLSYKLYNNYIRNAKKSKFSIL